ncbi:MAG TPA: ribonuclease T2 [Beijerinckiaceae bacterium]|nr:ribonuclease T2 [Beijerinckiaceae bacterium]
MRAAGLAAALALLATFAAAQPSETRGGTPGAFDFYVLALSWSPGFCEVEGDAKGREQCAPGSGLGFVVHGLWPQFERGYPTECGAGRGPSRLDLEEASNLFPSEGLARHQWRRHGTCSGESPSGYFRAVRRARERVKVPPAFEGAAGDVRTTPLEVERAFAAANPGLRADMMAVACRRGVLQEVRVCLTRDLRAFRTCPEVDRSGCRFGDLAVPAPR